MRESHLRISNRNFSTNTRNSVILRNSYNTFFIVYCEYCRLLSNVYLDLLLFLNENHGFGRLIEQIHSFSSHYRMLLCYKTNKRLLLLKHLYKILVIITLIILIKNFREIN